MISNIAPFSTVIMDTIIPHAFLRFHAKRVGVDDDADNIYEVDDALPLLYIAHSPWLGALTPNQHSQLVTRHENLYDQSYDGSNGNMIAKHGEVPIHDDPLTHPHGTHTCIQQLGRLVVL